VEAWNAKQCSSKWQDIGYQAPSEPLEGVKSGEDSQFVEVITPRVQELRPHFRNKEREMKGEASVASISIMNVAKEQAGGLYVSQTISEDRTNDDKDNRDRLCALSERKRKRPLEEGIDDRASGYFKRLLIDPRKPPDDRQDTKTQ
jgi:hypothetical protein